MVFNATSTIFQQYCRGQFYLMQETGVPGENHRPVASHCQTLIIYLYQIYILVTIYFTMILYNIGWCVIFPCCFSFLTIDRNYRVCYHISGYQLPSICFNWRNCQYCLIFYIIQSKL